MANAFGVFLEEVFQYRDGNQTSTKHREEVEYASNVWGFPLQHSLLVFLGLTRPKMCRILALTMLGLTTIVIGIVFREGRCQRAKTTQFI